MRLLLTASASLFVLAACAPETAETEAPEETITESAADSGGETTETAAPSDEAGASEEGASIEPETETADPVWGYEGEISAASWGSLNEAWETCSAGLEQSPIDFAVTELDPAEAPVLNWQASSAATILDNGKTIQVNLTDAGGLVLNGTEYSLLQFHFHAGSEHTVAGEQYPLEVHFVHASEAGELAVVGVFYEEGAAQLALDPIWSNLPEGVGEVETALSVDANDFLPSNMDAWRYAGSLTTPPCSEGVAWTVLEEPISLSAEQLAGYTARYDNNFRPVQPLGERTIGAGSVSGSE